MNFGQMKLLLKAFFLSYAFPKIPESKTPADLIRRQFPY